jgi:hypothetical protein
VETFDLGPFRVTVRQVGFSGAVPFWRISFEAPGIPPLSVEAAGAGPPAALALDFVRDLLEVLRAGVERYVSAVAMRERAPAGAVRAHAVRLHRSASAIGEEALARAEAILLEPARPGREAEEIAEEIEEGEEGAEEVAAIFQRDFDLGVAMISVRLAGPVTRDILAFHILLEAPDVREEDQMMRPVGYLLSQVAADHVRNIRKVLAIGVPAAVKHHMKMNLLRESMAPLVERYIERLNEVGRALGDEALAHMEEALVAGAGAERAEREEMAVQALERHERELEERIRRLRERRR